MRRKQYVDLIPYPRAAVTKFNNSVGVFKMVDVSLLLTDGHLKSSFKKKFIAGSSIEKAISKNTWRVLEIYQQLISA